MRRILFAAAVTLGLALTSGCFNRPTEAKVKSEGGGNFDRLKGMKSGGQPDEKAKGGAKGGTRSGGGKRANIPD